MASIAEQVTGERMARMVLSMIVEPDDPATGHVLAQVGGVQTLALIENNDPIPGMARVEAMVWREHLASHLDRGLAARAVEAEGRGVRTLIPADPEWPAGLNDIGVRAPYVLWTRGATSLLTSPLRERVTITGARAATAYGMQIASDLAGNLADDEGSSWPVAPSGSRVPPTGARLPEAVTRSRCSPVVWTGPTRLRIARCWNVSVMSACWSVSFRPVRRRRGSGSWRVAGCWRRCLG